LLRKERQEPSPREASLDINLPGAMRHRDLKDRLCEIDGDGRMLHPGLLLPLAVTGREPWHDDAVRQEESITSAAAAAFATSIGGRFGAPGTSGDEF
jgi:hypothetical protein